MLSKEELEHRAKWPDGTFDKEAATELLSLREQLAAIKGAQEPVVLPEAYAVRAGHPINEGERSVMIPKHGGNWLSRFDVEHAIRVAGFTVEGE